MVVTGAERGSEVSCRRHREGGGDVTNTTRGFAVPASTGGEAVSVSCPFPCLFIQLLARSRRRRDSYSSRLTWSRLGPSPLPSKHNHSVSWRDWKSPYPNPLDRDRKGEKTHVVVARGKKIALSLCVTKIADDRISPRRPQASSLLRSPSLLILWSLIEEAR